MTFKNTLRTLVVLAVSAISFTAHSQTIINSLAELKDRLDDSNGNFKMTPGTYYFNTDNCGQGNLFPSADILLFTGSNSTFDFTNVKFEFDSEIFAESYSSWAVQFWPTGNNNVYLNLTMEITGNATPNAGGESVHLDGNDNRIEGFHSTVRSSYPYGYGDIFGKGGGSVIGHKKRAGMLVRGDRNHLLNCTVLMRSYGHGIFMQGAEDALIEGCYVEGEIRTIREVLEEEGTASPADNVDFETVWGFNLRDLEYDYSFSLQEDGIRAYTTGNIYGTSDSRSTTGTQVVNCTVVQMRSGVTIGWDYTAKIVNNCKVLACGTGYWFGSNTTATNCSGDASIGPLFSEDVGRSNSTVDLTLLDNYIPKIGNTPHLFFAGNGHDLTLHDGTTRFDETIILQVGGSRQAHRWLEGSPSEPINRGASNLTFTNNTKYPILLESNASNNDIISCGPVTDNGSGNDITLSGNCGYDRVCLNTAENLEAECYDNMSGVVVEDLGANNDKAVGTIRNGDWISFNGIDLTNMASIMAIAGTDKEGVSIEIRQGSDTGTLLGTLPIPVTTSFFDYQETPEADLLQTVTGSTDLYFVFTGPAGFLFNLDKLSFVSAPCSDVSYDPVLPVGAEDYCFASGVSLAELDNANQAVTDIQDGDYIRFSNIHFGTDNIYNSIRVLASSNSEGGAIEVRTGSLNGTLLTTIDINDTGGWDDYKVFNAYTAQNLSGTHDLYFVFTGTSNSLFQLDNIRFLYDQCAGRSYNAYDRIEAEDFCENGGVSIINDYIGNVQDGDWIRFSDVDFTALGPISVTLSLSGFSSDGYVDVRLDNPNNGTLIATTDVTSTEGWTNWQEFTTNVIENVVGVHDVYIYFGDAGNNMNWFQFYKDPCNTSVVKNPTHIEAEDFCEMSNVAIENSANGVIDIGSITDGSWVKFSNYDFTDMKSLDARVSTTTGGGTIEVRLDDLNGSLIGSLLVSTTGDWDDWEQVSSNLSTVSGTHDIYMVFTGGSGFLFNVDWFSFSEDELIITDVAANKLSKIVLYPNPTSDMIHLSEASAYSVFNSHGQEVVRGEGSEVDLTNKPKGVYLIHLGESVQKVVKN